MIGRDRVICVVCLVLAAGLLAAAGLQLDPINGQRERMNLVIDKPLENAPPSLAFATVAMGAFRGLVVDILWMRADKLKEEGQFFDAKQLAEWITVLQPRFGAVWEFQAWNMAYNISVAIPASQPDQRWQWVKNGYELLRDKGIPCNRKNVQLYRQLGWIFQHKIGANMDDAHKYYKVQLAKAMQPLVGGADNAMFEAMAAAPTQWSQVASDSNYLPLIDALKAADPNFRDEGTFVSRYLSMLQNPERFNPRARKVLDMFQGAAALRSFDVFARAWDLRHTWKMEPGWMQEINRTYGPVDFNDPNRTYAFDWRNADCHAIYWAVAGLKAISVDPNRELDGQEMNTDRLIIHSIQNLFRSGRLFFFEAEIRPQDPNATDEQPQLVTDVFMRPDLRMADRYGQVYLAMMAKYRDDPSRVDTMDSGYRNWLKNAFLQFYQAGHIPAAGRLYNRLRERWPQLEEFKVSMAEYARKRFIEEFESLSITDATEQILALLQEGYALYGIGSDDEAAVRDNMAQQVYDYFQRKVSDPGRMELPALRWLRYTSMVDLFNDPQYPPYVKDNLLRRIQVERPSLYQELQKQRDEELSKQALQKSQTPPSAN